MADYTRAELRTKVRTLLNEPATGLFLDSYIDEWLNQAQRDIAAKTKCIESSETVATVNGTLEYTYTGIDVLHVTYQDRALLKYHSPVQQGGLTYNGVIPEYFYVWGVKFGVLPKPLTIHSLNVYTALDSTDFANDSSTSNLPAIFQQSMILFAFYRGLFKYGRYAQAAQVLNQYVVEIQYAMQFFKVRIPDGRDDVKIPDSVTKVQR